MISKLFIVLTLAALSLGSPLLKRGKQLGIIGGDETTIEKNPWQVSIQLLGLHNCGGSVISPDTIVTAAHCVDIFLIFSSVVAGSTDLSTPNISVSIKESFVHELYNELDYDVAVIKLAENLTLSEKIQPIPLAESRPADNATVRVSGYGVTSEGGLFTSNILREVDVNVVNQDTCNEDYSQYGGVTDRNICAAVQGGGKDACQGDSGGPLVDEDGNLVGIVSWGVGCAEAAYPGVYTDVASVRDWIIEKANL